MPLDHRPALHHIQVTIISTRDHAFQVSYKHHRHEGYFISHRELQDVLFIFILLPWLGLAYWQLHIVIGQVASLVLPHLNHPASYQAHLVDALREEVHIPIPEHTGVPELSLAQHHLIICVY